MLPGQTLFEARPVFPKAGKIVAVGTPEPGLQDLGLAFGIRFPTDAEEELLRRFTVTLNHVDHLRLWIENEYGVGMQMYEALAAEVLAMPAFQRVKRRPADESAISRNLAIAWMSELQLLLPEALGAAELLRYANSWAPVHAYYAVYLGLQAWFEANGIGGVADDHSASLRTISVQIRDRRLFPEPWSLLAVGCPMRRERAYLNVPDGADVAGDLEVLANPVLEDFWPRYGTWLRSTRRARLMAREDEWKRRNSRVRIPSTVRTRISQAVWPTSFFDCLWRMRIRSNYRDVEPYLVRFVSDEQARRFHEAMRVLVAATLTLLELYVARAVGGSALLRAAESFTAADRIGLSAETVAARLAAYEHAVPLVVRA